MCVLGNGKAWKSAREGAGVRARLEKLGAGLGALFGETNGLLDLTLDVGVDLREAVAEARRLEVDARAGERVALLALLELGRGAVLAGVAHRVAAEAVGAHLDEGRLAALARTRHGFADALLDLEHVANE